MGRPPFSVLGFVGQKRALAPIIREQDGALARGEPSPHTLFTGLSGLGKSRAAKMLAERASVACAKFGGTETVDEVAARLPSLKHGDFAFFDEAHKLSANVQELLYELIDFNSLSSSLAPNSNGAERTVIGPLTLIFATDQPGKLLNALFKRIPSHVHFASYPDRELKEIVSQVAQQRNMLLSSQAALQLAKVCNGLPRRAEHHVAKLRLHFADSESKQMGLREVREYLVDHGIDRYGFAKCERAYLEFLRRNCSASIEALVGYLGTDAAYIRKQIEQPLRFRGLITVRSSGRVLTRAGAIRARRYHKLKKKRGSHD